MKGEYPRDEDEQPAYLHEVLDVFDDEGVDAAFVYTFARYDLPHRDDPALDPLARLERFVRFHIDFSLDSSDAVFLSYMELRNLTPENFDRIARLRGAYEGLLEGILRAGIAAGVMRIEDPKLTTLALIAMLTGVTDWYREGGRLDRARIVQIYWGLARGAVGA